MGPEMLFLDTSAFLAIENRRDTHHQEALRFRDACFKDGRMLITSDYILDESYTLMRFRAGFHIAVQFGEALRASRLIRIEHITPEITEKAWLLFKQFSDHEFSFTDCTSFVLMERLHIQTAFTFDHHFNEYGRFTIRP
jgi:predicted nucleic acid-binding protein